MAKADRWLGEEGTVTACAVMAVLTDFVAERLRTLDYEDNIVGLFDSAERLLASDSEAIRDAVATCFLENLLNATPDVLNPDSFVPFLGPQSREFCRGWDEFTGVRTPGLMQPIPIGDRIILQDKTGERLGELVVQKSDYNSLSGPFSPASGYAPVRDLFAWWTEIVNNQMFGLIDEVEDRIAAMGIVALHNDQPLPTQDIQIYDQAEGMSVYLKLSS